MYSISPFEIKLRKSYNPSTFVRIGIPIFCVGPPEVISDLKLRFEFFTSSLAVASIPPSALKDPKTAFSFASIPI